MRRAEVISCATPAASTASRSTRRSIGRIASSTYQRWADDVPERFRFAVKMPKAITHEGRLVDCRGALAAFPRRDRRTRRQARARPRPAPSEPGVRPRDRASVLSDAPRDGSTAMSSASPGTRHGSPLAVDAFLAQWRVARVAADPAAASGRRRTGRVAGTRVLSACTARRRCTIRPIAKPACRPCRRT